MGALSRRHSITLDISLGAPYVLLPLDCAPKSCQTDRVGKARYLPLLVAHLGHISVWDTESRPHDCSAGESSDDDQYDYKLRLTSLEIFTLRSCDDWTAFCEAEDAQETRSGESHDITCVADGTDVASSFVSEQIRV